MSTPRSIAGGLPRRMRRAAACRSASQGFGSAWRAPSPRRRLGVAGRVRPIWLLTKFVVQVNNMVQQRACGGDGRSRPAAAGVRCRRLFELVEPEQIRHHRNNGRRAGPREDCTMKRKSQSNTARVTRRTFTAGLGAAGFIAGTAPFNIVRAQGGAAESRRAAAALRLPGRHRPGLPARRRYRGRHPQGSRPAAAADHERRHRDQRRCRALARREADRRGRAASGRRLRFRPEHGHRAGRRAEGHPLRHQHRRRPADHRAGLQVRVPQLPDRAA